LNCNDIINCDNNNEKKYPKKEMDLRIELVIIKMLKKEINRMDIIILPYLK